MHLQDLFWSQLYRLLYFPGSSAGVESAYNAGDPGLIPGSGRFAGEGIGYPLQYSKVSLVAQLVKSACNVGDLRSIPGLGRPLEKGMAIHSSILAWRVHRLYSPWGRKALDTTERLSLSYRLLTDGFGTHYQWRYQS